MKKLKTFEDWSKHRPMEYELDDELDTEPEGQEKESEWEGQDEPEWEAKENESTFDQLKNELKQAIANGDHLAKVTHIARKIFRLSKDDPRIEAQWRTILKEDWHKYQLKFEKENPNDEYVLFMNDTKQGRKSDEQIDEFEKRYL